MGRAASLSVKQGSPWHPCLPGQLGRSVRCSGVVFDTGHGSVGTVASSPAGGVAPWPRGLEKGSGRIAVEVQWWSVFFIEGATFQLHHRKEAMVFRAGSVGRELPITVRVQVAVDPSGVLRCGDVGRHLWLPGGMNGWAGSSVALISELSKCQENP